MGRSRVSESREEMVFTSRELAYLRSQPLGRIATVRADGQPDNAAVGFRVGDDGVITVGGMDVAGSRKGRNVFAGQPRVAFLVDDLQSVRPWRPRGIRIYGRAELVGAEGDPPHGGQLRITPEVSWSWQIENDAMSGGGFRPHRTIHQGAGRTTSP
jgi:pyridoxamine 5'-phosphate oxidase family protein